MARYCGKVAIAGEISGGDLPTARKSKVTCRTLPRSVTTPTNSWNSSDAELNTMGRSHKHPTLIHSQEMKTVAPKGESRKSEMTHCWYHIFKRETNLFSLSIRETGNSNGRRIGSLPLPAVVVAVTFRLLRRRKWTEKRAREGGRGRCSLPMLRARGGRAPT